VKRKTEVFLGEDTKARYAELTKRFARNVADSRFVHSPWQCTECSKPFDTLFKVLYHAELDHLHKAMGIRDKEAKDTFERITLKYLKKVEDPNRSGCSTWQCSECGTYQNQRKFHVQNHVEQAHVPKDPQRYACSQCEYQSYGYKNYEKHALLHAKKMATNLQGWLDQLTATGAADDLNTGVSPGDDVE